MPITGEGLKNVMLVSDKSWHSQHYMMDRLLQRAGGLDKAHFFFGDLYTPNLAEECRKRDVKVIVALGEQVLNRLYGEKDILRWRGRVLDWDSRFLIPTFAPHRLLPENPNATGFLPGAVMNPPRFQGVWMLDVHHALHVAKHGFARKRANYQWDIPPEAFERWAEGYFTALAADPLGVKLSYDIETAYKQKKKNEDEFDEADSELADGTMLRISFTYREGEGISVPWMPAYFGTVQRLVASPGIKVGWNCLTFDNPILEKNGAPVNGMVYDGMDMFHFYQSDLPRGLEWVTSFTSDMLPWKHLNYSDPGLYSAIDPDAALRNVNWLETKLKSTGQWKTYLNHYARLMPAMAIAGKRGCFIDIGKRDELREAISKELAGKLAEIQPLVPHEIFPRKRYKREPWDFDTDLDTRSYAVDDPKVYFKGRTFEPVTVTGPVKFCTICGARDVTKGEHFKGTKEPLTVAKGKDLYDGESGFVYDHKTGKQKFASVKNPCKVAGGTIEVKDADIVEWDEILPFNPNSGDQLKAYARHFGHPIGTDVRDSTKETMDSGHLKQLAKDYPDHVIYKLTVEYHKLSKTLGTYIYDPDEDGLIHTTYANTPSTPRFSSKNKNLQNVGKREDNIWATKAREQLIARPGHRYVQADSSAIEALVQGWWMNDPVYMELATQSVHAWVVAKMNGIEWDGSEEQVAFLKSHYKNDYNKFKTANYLTNFGGGPYLMWKTAPETFPTQEDAKRTQDMLYAMLPKLKEFHHWVRTKAQKEGYLELPGWKHRHYFFDVFTTDPKSGKVKYGRDAKRVCAFYPQGCAAAFMRDNSLLLAYGDAAAEWLGIEPLGLGDGYLQWFPANFVVHDGYTLEPPDGKEDEAAAVLETVLTRPIPQLSNLRVGCEVDISPVGGNWAPHHPKKNPMGLVTVKTVRVPVVPPPSGIRSLAA